MNLQLNVESEPRYTLAGESQTLAYRLVVVNPMICKYMLCPPLIAATRVSAVGQYMFKQADHSIHWLGPSQLCVSQVRSPFQVRSIVNVA